jgi:Na+-transporting NADH:ubiquinone oxidoreductase subunit D
LKIENQLTAPVACGPCAGKGLCDGKGHQTLIGGVYAQNPVWVQVLGICSALAVTNRLENALVMGAALVFVSTVTNVCVSILRDLIPHRIRLIAEVAIIATFVILFDLVLKAYYWPMSKQLGPYVGLIITNCIVMGRAEAFALQNRPLVSALDGAANGLGYALVLAVIATVRELLGAGTLLGRQVLSRAWYEPNQVMVLAPGAFFALAFLVAAIQAARKPAPEKKP